MEINIRDDRKIVEVWLTNAEKNDHELREKLKPFYRNWAAKKYLVAVFLSGELDLMEGTCALLHSNCKLFAKRAAKQLRVEE